MRKTGLKHRSRRKTSSGSTNSSSNSNGGNHNGEGTGVGGPNGEGGGEVKRKPTGEEAALTSKNYRLAKELSELRVRHRDETKTVTRLTMENMNLASRCREAMNHVSMLKKELLLQQRKSAEAVMLSKKYQARAERERSGTLKSHSPPQSHSPPPQSIQSPPPQQPPLPVPAASKLKPSSDVTTKPENSSSNLESAAVPLQHDHETKAKKESNQNHDSIPLSQGDRRGSEEKESRAVHQNQNHINSRSPNRNLNNQNHPISGTTAETMRKEPISGTAQQSGSTDNENENENENEIPQDNDNDTNVLVEEDTLGPISGISYDTIDKPSENDFDIFSEGNKALDVQQTGSSPSSSSKSKKNKNKNKNPNGNITRPTSPVFPSSPVFRRKSTSSKSSIEAFEASFDSTFPTSFTAPREDPPPLTMAFDAPDFSDPFFTGSLDLSNEGSTNSSVMESSTASIESHQTARTTDTSKALNPNNNKSKTQPSTSATVSFTDQDQFSGGESFLFPDSAMSSFEEMDGPDSDDNIKTGKTDTEKFFASSALFPADLSDEFSDLDMNMENKPVSSSHVSNNKSTVTSQRPQDKNVYSTGTKFTTSKQGSILSNANYGKPILKDYLQTEHTLGSNSAPADLETNPPQTLQPPLPPNIGSSGARRTHRRSLSAGNSTLNRSPVRLKSDDQNSDRDENASLSSSSYSSALQQQQQQQQQQQHQSDVGRVRTSKRVPSNDGDYSTTTPHSLSTDGTDGTTYSTDGSFARQSIKDAKKEWGSNRRLVPNVSSNARDDIRSQSVKGDEIRRLDSHASTTSTTSTPKNNTPSTIGNPVKQRSVKQPVSYAEPSLVTKLRRGDVFFPKKDPSDETQDI